MAKRKTKKEEVVDLTPKPEKITDEQLKRVQGIIDNINRHQMEVGITETRKHSLLHNLAGIQDQLTLVQEELRKEYDTIDINLQDGTINYPPEPNILPPEPTILKDNGETNKKD